MTSFGHWQDLAAARGLFMCDICFESFPREEAWRDRTGQAWTLCVPCAGDDGSAAACASE